jgi:hypothetical protein
MSICIVPDNEPIYQALIDKAASYPIDETYKAKAYEKAAKFVEYMTDSIYDEKGGPNYWWDAPPKSGVGKKIEAFINEYTRANPDPDTAKPVVIHSSKPNKYGVSDASYKYVCSKIRKNFPNAKPHILTGRVDYAFKTGLWRYIPDSYNESDEDNYERDDGYNSDATEYCLVRGGVKCVIPREKKKTINRIVLELFRNDNWTRIAYDVRHPDSD